MNKINKEGNYKNQVIMNMKNYNRKPKPNYNNNNNDINIYVWNKLIYCLK